MSVQELLGEQFVRAYEHEDGDLVILEREDGRLVQIQAIQTTHGAGRLDVDWIDAFDDGDFTEVGIHY